jgi:hypothetical protein
VGHDYWIEIATRGKKGEEAASEETPPNKRVSGSSRLALSDYDDVGTRAVDD